MEKIVTITPEESENVENLYSTYMSYLGILQYLAENSTSNSTLYDKKWEETSILGTKLTKAKRDIESKYKPAGNWERFEFDFNNHQVVFSKRD